MLTTNGIVWKLLRYGDTGLILDIYTEALGLEHFLIQGVFKKGNSKQAALFQLLHQIEFVSYYIEGKSLHRIKEAQFHYVYHDLPFNIHKSAIAYFLLEVLRNCVSETQQNQALFEYFSSTLQFIDTTKDSVSNIHLIALTELTEYFGFTIQNNYSPTQTAFNLKNGNFSVYDNSNVYHVRPDISQHIAHLLDLNIQQAHNFDCNHITRRAILTSLLQYYQYHIEHFSPKQCLAVYRDVL